MLSTTTTKRKVVTTAVESDLVTAQKNECACLLFLGAVQ